MKIKLLFYIFLPNLNTSESDNTFHSALVKNVININVQGKGNSNC